MSHVGLCLWLGSPEADPETDLNASHLLGNAEKWRKKLDREAKDVILSE